MSSAPPPRPPAAPATTAEDGTPTTRERFLHGLTAAAAWAAVLLNVIVSAAGGFVETVPKGHLYGVNAPGWEGLGPRVADTLSYFTIWSNAVVAISSTQLARSTARTPVTAVLRLSALLMITITAIVYAVLLAPTATVVGWSVLTNPLAHVVVPALTVLSFLVVGPRRWIDRRVLLGSLVIPFGWIVYMLVRGAVIGAYPYGFADVASNGYASVLAWLGGILVFALAVAALYWLADRLLR